MIVESELENRAFGYNIGRCKRLDFENIHQLKEEIIAKKIDLLKLNLRDSGPDLYLLLEQLNYPFYILGIVIEYKSNFRLNKFKPYLNDELDFVEYLGEEPETFKNLVKEIFKNTPASYYQNPDFFEITDHQKQIECLADYISQLNAGYNSNFYTHLLKFKGELAGFITSYRENDGGAATYAGILKKFEGKGLYLDLVSFIQNYGKEIGQNWGTASTQIQNTVVQKAFQKAGLFPNGYELNIHINCKEGKLKI